MHFEGFRITPPPALLTSAPVGQAAAQEGSSQALQTITLYPRSTPPMLETWIADLDNPPSLNLREQANMQDMQAHTLLNICYVEPRHAGQKTARVEYLPFIIIFVLNR